MGCLMFYEVDGSLLYWFQTTCYWTLLWVSRTNNTLENLELALLEKEELKFYLMILLDE